VAQQDDMLRARTIVIGPECAPVLSKNPIDAKTECLCGSVLALASIARQRFW